MTIKKSMKDNMNYNSDVSNFFVFVKKQKNYSSNTVKNYEIDIKEFFNYLSSQCLEYKDITYDDITGYLVLLNENDLASATISRKLSSLRSFYKYLYNNGIINENPMKFVSSPKKEKKLPRYLTIDELKQIFSVPNINTPLGQRDRLILEVLYSTGLRVSELVSLKLDDIDFDGKEIRVLGKGNKQRIVYFNDTCLYYIDLFIADGRKTILEKNNTTNDYLIINGHGKSITTRGIEKILDDILRKSYLKKKVTPHMLRHSFATHLLNEGCDILTVKELLGHASLESTQIYTHVSNEKLKEVYNKFHPLSKK